MEIKHLLNILVLVILALTTAAVVVSAAEPCRPQPQSATCTPTPECEGIIRKDYTLGCKRKNGKPFNDGGCQCKGYCGYKCASACQADPECRWNKSKKKCFNIATGKPGNPIKICSATHTPTTSPTLNPTKAPTVKPYCTQETEFPGGDITTENMFAIAMTPNGDKVLMSETVWEETSGNKKPISTMWITSRNKKNGKWIPTKLGTYNNTAPYSGAMSNDGTHLVYFVWPYGLTRIPGQFSSNLTMVFLKRNANGNYNTVDSYDFPSAYDVHPLYWMSPKGDTTIVSYLAETDAPYELSPKITLTFVREKENKWRLDKTQEKVLLQDFSRDGKTAFSYGVNETSGETFRRVWVRKNNKEWSLQVPNLIASGSPGPAFQGRMGAFTSNGKMLIISTNSDMYNQLPPTSGGFLFTRSTKGEWKQVTKVGGENSTRQGESVGISDDSKTIMLSEGTSSLAENGFLIFKKKGKGNNWVQAGGTVYTSTARRPWLNAKGNRVITLQPPTVWNC